MGSSPPQLDPGWLTPQIGNPSLPTVKSGFLAITEPLLNIHYFPMTTRLSGPLPPSGEMCVDNEFAMVNHATTEYIYECFGQRSCLRRAAAELVLPDTYDHGWPVIVKPRIGSSRGGVVRLEGPADPAAVCFEAEPLVPKVYCADARAIHVAFPRAQCEVFAPWGAYPPRLSAANIGYRADMGSTFHTDMRQISDSGSAPQTGGEY